MLRKVIRSESRQLRVRTNSLATDLSSDSFRLLATAAIAGWRAAIGLENEGVDANGESIRRWHFETLSALCHLLKLPFDMIALNDLALSELASHSSVEAILLTESIGDSNPGEDEVGCLLNSLKILENHGVPLRLELRDWKDLPRVSFVRSYESFELYQIASITMYERYEFGSARLIYGRSKAIELVLEAAYSEPLTNSVLDHLLKLKWQIEEQSVAKKHARRNVKLGVGGITDIEWFVRLHEMRFYTAENAPREGSLTERIRGLARAKHINAAESQELIEAYSWLANVRLKIARFGFTPDVLPENPTKLDRVGVESGYADGNAFLAAHERVIESVRAIYNEGIERLRV